MLNGIVEETNSIGTGWSGIEVVPYFLVCLVVALAVGLFIAVVYTHISRCTKGFAVTLAVLPAAICVVIMMVNGSIGTGVAVAGAFSLVRFRSAPGTADEIGAIFLAMATGLIIGMGYFGIAVLFAVILVGASLLFNKLPFLKKQENSQEKTLRITIPESLDYSGVFEPVLQQYTSSYSVEDVKTTNMGSMLKITYQISLQNASQEKEFIDQLRCRNGNLEISISRRQNSVHEL